MSTESMVRAHYCWDKPRRPSWPQFALWVLVGPVMISGVLAAFTPLIVISAPVSGLLVLAIGSKGGMNASAFGALTGVGAALGVVGYFGLLATWIVAGLFVVGGFAGYLAVTKSDERTAGFPQPGSRSGRV